MNFKLQLVRIYYFVFGLLILTTGGWLDDKGVLVEEYLNYADTVFAALSEVGVRDWITFNEPYVFCFLGYS